MNNFDLSRPTSSYSKYIIQLQEYLRALSYEYKEIPSLAVNGVFDERTLNALNSFQSLMGIDISSKADPHTWSVLRKEYDRLDSLKKAQNCLNMFYADDIILRPGDHHPYLYWLQHAFNILSTDFDNFIETGHTGYLDSETVQNVETFRKATLLPKGSHVDKDLINKLVLVQNSIK